MLTPVIKGEIEVLVVISLRKARRKVLPVVEALLVIGVASYLTVKILAYFSS